MQEYSRDRQRGYRDTSRDQNNPYQQQHEGSFQQRPAMEGGRYDSDQNQQFSRDWQERHSGGNRYGTAGKGGEDDRYARYGAPDAGGNRPYAGSAGSAQTRNYGNSSSEGSYGGRQGRSGEPDRWGRRESSGESSRYQDSPTYQAMSRGGRFDSDSRYGGSPSGYGGSYPQRSSSRGNDYGSSQYGSNWRRRQDEEWGRDFSRGSGMASRTGDGDRSRERDSQSYREQGSGRAYMGGYSQQGGSRYGSESAGGGGSTGYGYPARDNAARDYGSGRQEEDRQRFIGSGPDATSSNWGGRYGRGYGSTAHQDEDDDRRRSDRDHGYGQQQQYRGQSDQASTRKFNTGNDAYDYGKPGAADYRRVDPRREREQEAGFLDKAAHQVAHRVRSWFGADEEHERRHRP